MQSIEDFIFLNQISNYKIENGKIEAFESVNISYLGEGAELPYPFSVIHGDFCAAHLGLKSLYNFPSKVEGSLYINGNRISSLQFCPKKIDGEFIARENLIEAISNIPIGCTKIDLSRNNIKSLKGLPEQVYGDLNLSENPFDSFEFAPIYVSESFIVQFGNFSSLKGFSKEVGKFVDVSNNKKLNSLQGIEETIIYGSFYAYETKISNLESIPKSVGRKCYFQNTDLKHLAKCYENFEEVQLLSTANKERDFLNSIFQSNTKKKVCKI